MTESLVITGALCFLIGLLTGFILTYFTPKVWRWFIYPSTPERIKDKVIEDGIKTTIKNQN